MIFEINSNLIVEQDYKNFEQKIYEVYDLFKNFFGAEIMEKYDLFIDNATKNSGYAPVITRLLRKHLTIKLGVEDFSNKEEIVFEISHEMCHYVFYSLKSLEKEKADDEEENICTAMSLIILNMLYPDNINNWINHVENMKEEKYNKGAKIARECNFNITILKDKIYKICNYKN